MYKKGRVWGIFPCEIHEDGEVHMSDSWLNDGVFDAFNSIVIPLLWVFGVKDPQFSISIDKNKGH